MIFSMILNIAMIDLAILKKLNIIFRLHLNRLILNTKEFYRVLKKKIKL